MSDLLDLLLHFDKKLGPILQHYGDKSYLLLAAFVFCQFGCILTWFLPGDSLLFAIGIFCHPEKSPLNVGLMFLTLICASCVGNVANYFVGKFFGNKLFRNNDSKIFKKSHLETTHQAFEKHGRLAMVFTPFVPIVRTFAPFAAGLGEMPLKTFVTFGSAGLILWIGLFLFGGYFIGGIKVVQDNFGVAVIVILVVTAAPLAWETWKAYREHKATKTTPPSA